MLNYNINYKIKMSRQLQYQNRANVLRSLDLSKVGKNVGKVGS
jgi:hypothetical protein